MLALLLEVLPLALAAAISPVVLMVALAILAGQRPVPEATAYAIGVTATTVVLYAIGLLVIRAQQDGLEPGWLGSDVARVIVSVMLIVAGVALFAVHPDPQRTEALERRLLGNQRTLRDVLAAGVFVMITNASSFVVLLAILHVVAYAGRPLYEGAVALVMATAIVCLPALAPLAVAVAGGAHARTLLARAGAVVTRYGRFVMGSLWILFGGISLSRLLF